MDRYSISDAAALTGFPASTLRFYEQRGLVTPSRTPAGYRCYDDRDVETLRLIRRAKGLGLTLDEITDLVHLMEEESCAPMQDRLRDLIDRSIADARRQVAELTAFTTELERVAGTLSVHTAEGACDEVCGCLRDPVEDGASPGSARVSEHADPVHPPIACTLAPDEIDQRIADWHGISERAMDRTAITDGVRLLFPRETDVVELTELVAAEQECCQFLGFTVGVSDDAVTLDVTGPSSSRPLIEALVGVVA